MWRRLATAAALLCIATGGASAQTFRGKLLQADGVTAATNARVWLLNGRGATVDTTRSNDQGRFELRAPRAGEYQIIIRRIGYVPEHTGAIRFSNGEIREEDIRLLSTQVLPTVDVAVSRDIQRVFGLDSRSLGSQFVRPEKVDQLRAFSLESGDLIRHANILGVQIQDYQAGDTCVVVRVFRGCAEIYLDGMHLGQSLPPISATEIDSFVVLKPLDGILVGGNGAVMIFTGR
jgi:hypothetical protein